MARENKNKEHKNTEVPVNGDDVLINTKEPEAPKTAEAITEKKEDIQNILSNTPEEKPTIKKMNDLERVNDPKNEAEIDKFLKEYKGEEPSQEVELETKKAELLAPENNKEIPKKIEKTKSETEEKSRWTEEDEAGRPGSKPATKKEKAPPKEKSEKKSGGIFKSIGRGITRPVRSAGKIVKTVGKTLRTPVGLTSYLLSDIGEKQNSGRKDRRAGYRKIWK